METPFQVINGTSLSLMCDHSFGDHLSVIDVNLIGRHYNPANDSNMEFFKKAKQFEGKIMTLFIDNIRLYRRPLWVNAGADAVWVENLLNCNDLLAMCRAMPQNNFIIFTSHEDTPIDETISVPDNVRIHAINAVYNNERIKPFPIGLQRQMGLSDNRLEIMRELVEKDEYQFPTKLLYINCGLGKERNEEERAYLPTFARFDWATCRFEPQSKFYPHSRYRDFLTELKDHKFIICPKGHGMDCHRNWETLYMRRVPIFLDHPYFRKLMEVFPTLFVKSWDEITPHLLLNNNHLYEQALQMDLQALNLNKLFNDRIYEFK